MKNGKSDIISLSERRHCKIILDDLLLSNIFSHDYSPINHKIEKYMPNSYSAYLHHKQ